MRITAVMLEGGRGERESWAGGRTPQYPPVSSASDSPSVPAARTAATSLSELILRADQSALASRRRHTSGGGEIRTGKASSGAERRNGRGLGSVPHHVLPVIRRASRCVE